MTDKYDEQQIRDAIKAANKETGGTLTVIDPDQIIAELRKPAVTFREGELYAYQYSPSTTWQYGITRGCYTSGATRRKLRLSEMPEEVEALRKAISNFLEIEKQELLRIKHQEIWKALAAFDEVIEP